MQINNAGREYKTGRSVSGASEVGMTEVTGVLPSTVNNTPPIKAGRFIRKVEFSRGGLVWG